MVHYDEPTSDFMHEVSGETLKDKALRQAKTVASTLVKGTSPQRMLAKQIARAAVEKMYEEPKIAGVKLAGLNIIMLFSLLNDHYNRQWWDWEPETLWRTLEEDHGIDSSDDLKNQVQALQVVVSTNAPFEHWHVFENVGQAFNGNMVHFGMVQPLDLDEVAWTFRVLRTIRPKEEFDAEIFGYAAASAKSAGVVFLPPGIFGDSQKYLDALNNDMALKEQIRLQWPNLKKTGDLNIDTQVDKLSAVVKYVGDMNG